MDKLPVYEMIIDEAITSDVEVSFVALVDKPAIERNFLTFNSQQLHFALDEEKKIISGPAMVADSLIYRKDDQGEYQVFFSGQTIRQIAEKFFKKDYHKNLNLFHDPTLSLEGVTIFESFVSDKSRGIQPMHGFKDLPDGTWFISAKIDNEIVWNKIKSGEVKGFSVEGIFSYIKKQKVLNGTDRPERLFEETIFMADVKDMWKAFKDKFLGELPKNVPTPTPQPKTPAVPATPAPGALNTDYQLKDGAAVSIDRLEAGGVVIIGGAPAAPGEYELNDNTKITVGDGGVITAIVPGAPPAPDFSAQFKAIDDKFTAYEQKFTAQQLAFNTLQTEFQKRVEMITQLAGIVEKMAEASTADPVGTNEKSFATQKADTKKEKLASFMQAFQKIKDNKN